ncbi:MAG TPA: BamA/TamA family outer membrane protein [Caulobacteraceae bacterium]|nr:BamA/TamA family outer membrane protein [Caulobacteraceae bacterium]
MKAILLPACALLAVPPAAFAADPPATVVPPAAQTPSPQAPSNDAELMRPLEPLDQFSQTPPEAAAAAPPAASVRYRVEVNGLDAVGLRSRFYQLSSLVQGQGKPAELGQVAARARADKALAERLLRSEGYYDGDVHVSVETEDGGAGVKAKIVATPGERYHLGEIIVTGPPTRPPDMARQAIGLKTGDPLAASAVEAGEARVRVRLPQKGYPFVKLGQRDIALDDETHTAAYELPVDPGKRASFGRVVAGANTVMTDKHLQVFPRFQPGDLYDSRKVEDLRQALVSTGVYGAVAVSDVDTGRPGPDDTDVVDLKVDGSPAKARMVSGALGYDTGLGATAQASWTDRDLFPPEGSLTLRALAGTQQSLVGVTFRRSDYGARDQSLQVLAQVSRETIDPYNASTAQIGVTLARESTLLWQKRWTWSVGILGEVSQEDSFTPEAVPDRRLYEVASLPLMLTYDRSNSLLNPTKGFKIIVQPSPSLSVGSGFQPYVKSVFDLMGYEPVSGALTLAGRVQVGTLFGASAQEIAPSQRFYAGGGGSVRGFAYEALGPEDTQGHVIGGASSTLFSAEARYRFKNDFGVVGFFDAGQAFTSSTPQVRDLREGIGVGVRYFTSFGPFRFDIATPLDRRPGDIPVGVYISIGQAF